MNDPIIQEELRNTEGTYYKTVEKEHKGVATREYYITENISWFKDKKEWKKLKSLTWCEKSLIKNGYELSNDENDKKLKIEHWEKYLLYVNSLI